MMDLNSRISNISNLSNISGVSGHERPIYNYVKKMLPNHDVEEDLMHNIYIKNKNFDENKPVVLIDAHSDEVGMIVQSFNRNGLLNFVKVGFIDDAILPGVAVRILNDEGKYVTGVIGTVPPHFSKGGTTAPLTIDVGAMSYEELVEKYKISLGAPVIFDVNFEFKPQTNMLFGKALDDRLGCACVIEVMRHFENVELNYNLVGTLTVQEEVGVRGIQVAANRLRPQFAVVVEGTPADDLYVDSLQCQGGLRRGVQVRLMDPTFISSKIVVNIAKEICQKNNIMHQLTVRTGGGTNAMRIQLHGFGVPTLVVGVPTRYVHAPRGLAALEDYVAMVDLSTHLFEYINTIDLAILRK